MVPPGDGKGGAPKGEPAVRCFLINNDFWLQRGELPAQLDRTLYFAAVVSSLFLLFSSPNFSGRRLDVYHTSTHGIALLQI